MIYLTSASSTSSSCAPLSISVISSSLLSTNLSLDIVLCVIISSYVPHVMFLPTAGVKKGLVNTPVEEIITEGQHTDVVCDVKFARPVKIQNRVK